VCLWLFLGRRLLFVILLERLLGSLRYCYLAFACHYVSLVQRLVGWGGGLVWAGWMLSVCMTDLFQLSVAAWCRAGGDEVAFD